MLTVKEVYEAIDAFAPFASQESWDNSGLLVGGITLTCYNNIFNIKTTYYCRERVYRITFP